MDSGGSTLLALRPPKTAHLCVWAWLAACQSAMAGALPVDWHHGFTAGQHAVPHCLTLQRLHACEKLSCAEARCRGQLAPVLSCKLLLYDLTPSTVQHRLPYVLQGMVKEVHPKHCKLTNGEEMDFGLAVWSTGGLGLVYVCLDA